MIAETIDGLPAYSPTQIKAALDGENAELRAEVERLRRELASFKVDYDRMEREWANAVLKSRGTERHAEKVDAKR